jgi:hypothetical protein
MCDACDEEYESLWDEQAVPMPTLTNAQLRRNAYAARARQFGRVAKVRARLMRDVAIGRPVVANVIIDHGEVSPAPPAIRVGGSFLINNIINSGLMFRG